MSAAEVIRDPMAYEPLLMQSLSGKPMGVNELVKSAKMSRGMVVILLDHLVRAGKVQHKTQWIKNYSRTGYYIGELEEETKAPERTVGTVLEMIITASTREEMKELAEEALGTLSREKKISVCVTTTCKNGYHGKCMGRCSKCNTACRCSCH